MRNRMIKVDFWSDEKVGSVSTLARLLFIGSWTLADDSGVCRAHPIFLKNNLFPYDEKITKKNISDSLDELITAGLVSFIDYQGESYIFINNFSKHQQINRPSDHRFVEVEGDDYSQLIEQSVSNHGVINGKVKVKEKVNVKEKINHAKAQLLKVWNENLERYTTKYPLLDYDLQRDLMLQWVEERPQKSLKKSNWNLFIQNWLSRSKRIYVPAGGISKGIPAQLIIDPKWDQEHYYDNYLTVSSDGRAKIEEMVALYEANDNKLGSKDRATLKEWKRDLEESK